LTSRNSRTTAWPSDALRAHPPAGSALAPGAGAGEPSDADLRALSTPSYVVFPATVIIVHPDFVSVILLHPLSAVRTDYEHVMLVPAGRRGDTAHWDRSWALIEDTVFQREDLWVCEQIQRGLAAGTTDELVFGELESAMRGFHAAIADALDAAGA
jgi:hypothetical protein